MSSKTRSVFPYASGIDLDRVDLNSKTLCFDKSVVDFRYGQQHPQTNGNLPDRTHAVKLDNADIVDVVPSTSERYKDSSKA